MRYKGGLISATPPATTTSKGVWTLTQQMQAVGGGVWPTIPGAPTSVSATADSASATVTFVAPAYAGYPAISEYRATSTPGSFTATGASSPLTVTGLSNGTAYTIAVQALNVAGYGPAGTSNSVTPFNPYFIAVIKPTSGDFYINGQAKYNTIASDGYYIVGTSGVGSGVISKISFEGTNTFTNNVTSVNENFQDNTEYFDSIHVASSGSVYTGGYVAAPGGTGSYVSKFDSSGNSTWTRQLRAFTYDVFGITTDSSENVYFTGSSTASFANYDNSTRMRVASFNSSGTLRWQTGYGTGASGFVGFTSVISGSSVYVVGNNYQTGSYVRRGILVKFSSSTGALESQRAYDGGSSFQDMAVGSSGALYISGSQQSPNATRLLKTDGSTRTWASTLATNSEICKVAVDGDENAYILSRANTPANSLVIAKFDSSGTIQWQRTLAFPAEMSGYQSISVNSAGRILVSTQINTSPPSQYYPFMAVLNPDGSGTGTYTLDGRTYVYAASAFTASTSSTDLVTPTNTLEEQTRSNFTFYNTPATYNVSVPKTAV
jgi:hypothetical protein